MVFLFTRQAAGAISNVRIMKKKKNSCLFAFSPDVAVALLAADITLCCQAWNDGVGADQKYEEEKTATILVGPDTSAFHTLLTFKN